MLKCLAVSNYLVIALYFSDLLSGSAEIVKMLISNTCLSNVLPNSYIFVASNASGIVT